MKASFERDLDETRAAAKARAELKAKNATKEATKFKMVHVDLNSWTAGMPPKIQNEVP